MGLRPAGFAAFGGCATMTARDGHLRYYSGEVPAIGDKIRLANRYQTAATWTVEVIFQGGAFVKITSEKQRRNYRATTCHYDLIERRSLDEEKQ